MMAIMINYRKSTYRKINIITSIELLFVIWCLVNSSVSISCQRNWNEIIDDQSIIEPLQVSTKYQLQERVNDNSDESLNDHDEIYLLEDKDYPRSLFEHHKGAGQVSGIATLPSGDVAIFHRADRQWVEKTFFANHSINDRAASENLIKNDTILIIDRDNGGSVTSFGSDLFYMPHSVASDRKGNLWLSDVARHQVLRLPASMLQVDNRISEGDQRRWLQGNMSRLWPDVILGEPFVPGHDETHFCQPAEIAVSSDGRLVFVADGYCNGRVMVFTGSGRFLTSFGERHGFSVVHSLALIEERNLICVADRDNGRILCFKAGLDGDLETIGEPVLNVNYPLGRVFAIATLSADYLLVSSNQFGTSRFDLAAINPFKKQIKQIWTSTDLIQPHSLATTRDRLYAYAADISRDAYKKVFKFNVIHREP